MALYRKYRPATFAEVVGQEHVTDPLSTALDTGRISHAYLFSGPRGCGKTSSARILARSLNCVQGPTSRPCGVCPSCVALGPGGSGNLDVIELDAASHGGVDDTRELRDRAFYAPAESRYRVFIVDEAHMVTTAGFNALLKIVEEPPAHLIFIFATTEPDKVLPTIRSRTHHYPFRLLPPATMRGLLGRICEQEHVPVEEAVYPLVIRAGGGSPRDSLSVLDQLLAGAGPEGVTYNRAVALLGVTDVALIDDAVAALATDDGAALFGTVDRVMEAGHDPRRFAVDLLERFRDLILLRAVPDAADRGLVSGPGDVLDRMREQAERIGSATLTRYAELLHEGLGEMRGATAPRLLLEVICARMLLPSVSDAESATLQRLERLERGFAGGVPAPSAAAPAAAPRTESPRPSGGDPSRRRGAEALAALREEKSGRPGKGDAASGSGPDRPDSLDNAAGRRPSGGGPGRGDDAVGSLRAEHSASDTPHESEVAAGHERAGGATRPDAQNLSAGDSPAPPGGVHSASPGVAGAEQPAGQDRPASPESRVGEPSPVPERPSADVPTESISARPDSAASSAARGAERGPAETPSAGVRAAGAGSGAGASGPVEGAVSSPAGGQETAHPGDAAHQENARPAARQAESATQQPEASALHAESGGHHAGPTAHGAESAARRAESGAQHAAPAAGQADSAGRVEPTPQQPEPTTRQAESAAQHADPAVRRGESADRAEPTAQVSESAVPAKAFESAPMRAAEPVGAPEPTPAMPAAAPAPSEPEATQADSSGAPDGEELRRAVESAWGDIRAKVREFGAAVHALLSGASVAGVEDGVIVFAHQHAPLAQRLSDPRNTEAVRSAVRAVLGRDHEIRWVVAGAAAQAPRGRGGQGGRSGQGGQGAATDRPAQGNRAAGTRAPAAPSRPPAPEGNRESNTPPRYSRPSQAKAGGTGGGRPAPPPRSGGDDDIPPPDYPDLPDDPGPGSYPPPDPVEYAPAPAVPGPLTAEEEQEMLAEAAKPVAPEDRRDPDEVALELLRSELGATRLDG
ncbi:DNA polymerase III subunit gamma and tau [Nocardia puris]|uniref:DNA polymerase III subunit gamma and tau n=1 Tax=Nocardia puris TaxID=208602 RepID=UPI002B4AAF4C|nr:DNA polymerase III subunit gamma and tau [Nocardia puris]